MLAYPYVSFTALDNKLVDACAGLLPTKARLRATAFLRLRGYVDEPALYMWANEGSSITELDVANHQVGRCLVGYPLPRPVSIIAITHILLV